MTNCSHLGDSKSVILTHATTRKSRGSHGRQDWLNTTYSFSDWQVIIALLLRFSRWNSLTQNAHTNYTGRERLTRLAWTKLPCNLPSNSKTYQWRIYIGEGPRGSALLPYLVKKKYKKWQKGEKPAGQVNQNRPTPLAPFLDPLLTPQNSILQLKLLDMATGRIRSITGNVIGFITTKLVRSFKYNKGKIWLHHLWRD